MHSATIFFALVAIAATATADHGWGHHAAPHYKYSYGVDDKKTGDHKSAWETREGDITKGSYSLVQPDGVLRTVNYVVDPKSGFKAQVINKGVAGHPHHGWGKSSGGAGGLGGAEFGLGHGGASSHIHGLGSPLAAGHGAGLGGVGFFG